MQTNIMASGSRDLHHCLHSGRLHNGDLGSSVKIHRYRPMVMLSKCILSWSLYSKQWSLQQLMFQHQRILQKSDSFDIDGIGDEVYSMLLHLSEASRNVGSHREIPYYKTPKHHKSYAPKHPKLHFQTRSHAAYKITKGKEIATPITPHLSQLLKIDNDPEQAQRKKICRREFGLIAKSFIKLLQNLPTNNSDTSSNTRNKNCGTAEAQNGLEDCHVSTRKRCCCVKQVEKGVQHSSRAIDWLADTDEKLYEQEVGSTLQLHGKDFKEVQMQTQALTCTIGKEILGTVRCGNDQFAPILVMGLGSKETSSSNEFYLSKGKRLISGNRGSDSYTISLQETTSSTPICLLAKASPTQAWLWHRRLSHLNFDYINLLSKKDIVIGLAPQRQKASDYDNPGPAPELQIVPFSRYNSSITNRSWIFLFEPSSLHNAHAEENKVDQAECTNPFCYTGGQWQIHHGIEAMQDENFISLTDYKSGKLVDKPFGKKDRSQAEVVMEINKQDDDQTVIRNKPRLVGKRVMLRNEGVVLLTQPDGFVDPDHPDNVYRLGKSLYGLKQAPRDTGMMKLSNSCYHKGFSKLDGKEDRIVLAMSSAEAEYVALSASCAQVMWMRTQLQDYGFNYNKIPLYCDSQSAIAISCNPVQHSRTKHIHTRYHFIKEQVENGIIELYFVRTEYQLADMFTKALPEERFQYLVRRIDGYPVGFVWQHQQAWVGRSGNEEQASLGKSNTYVLEDPYVLRLKPLDTLKDGDGDGLIPAMNRIHYTCSAQTTKTYYKLKIQES
ncbi:retrovirus-related pol polyprotein from transposon TNT 1-94 [Tanacetum coccineum]